MQDKHGVPVVEGSVIQFPESENTYVILKVNGELGAFEGEEFIALKECLRNFVVLS